jgi:photosystem II stability/assembly factor-like uncharacterized protein
VPGGFQPQSVSFVSAQEGWVLGGTNCSSGRCAALLRTVDGGSSWSSIPAPAAVVGSAPSDVDEVRYADPLDGWISGSGVLWATHDGGRHWVSVGIPGAGAAGAAELLSLEPVGAYAYALALQGSGAQPATANVYRTAVAGDAWSAQPGTAVAAATDGRLVAHAGAVFESVDVSGAPGTLRALVNGAWLSRPLPCSQGGATVAAADAEHLSTVCAQGAAAGSQPKLAYLSSDGGSHWSPAGSAPASGDMVSSAMAAPGAIVVAAASGASWLYASFDGGRTWSTVLTDTQGGGAPWEDLGFTNQEQGVVVEGVVGQGGPSGSRLFFTHDGGHTWSAVTFA